MNGNEGLQRSPDSSVVITGTLFRTKTQRVAFHATEPDVPERPPVARRPAHVARMLALAHHLRAAIERGLVTDQAAVARGLGFTRARVTQLIDLTLLAPDVQEAVLGLEAIDGAEPMSERALRTVLHAKTWEEQRVRYSERHLGSTDT